MNQQKVYEQPVFYYFYFIFFKSIGWTVISVSFLFRDLGEFNLDFNFFATKKSLDQNL